MEDLATIIGFLFFIGAVLGSYVISKFADNYLPESLGWTPILGLFGGAIGLVALGNHLFQMSVIIHAMTTSYTNLAISLMNFMIVGLGSVFLLPTNRRLIARPLLARLPSCFARQLW